MDIEIVRTILQTKESARDNDIILWAEYLKAKGIDLKETSAHTLLKYLLEQRYAGYDTVSRLRRKLQEEDAGLRGEKWDDRQKMKVKVKSDLGYYQQD